LVGYKTETLTEHKLYEDKDPFTKGILGRDKILKL